MASLIPAGTVNRWRLLANHWLESQGLPPPEKIQKGSSAWTIAHRSGITEEAYAIDRRVTDAHIQTALEKIFPNALFLDRKRY